MFALPPHQILGPFGKCWPLGQKTQFSLGRFEPDLSKYGPRNSQNTVEALEDSQDRKISCIGHSVIGRWSLTHRSLTHLGHRKHVANLGKLTNLTNLENFASEIKQIILTRSPHQE